MNLFGIVKLLLLKVSVGAIVVQGLIESFVYTSGASPYKDDDVFSAEEKTLRAYCKLILKLLLLIVQYVKLHVNSCICPCTSCSKSVFVL